MSKAHHTSKDLKKKPLLTPKEKKTAKQVKKHNHDVQPFIIPVTTHWTIIQVKALIVSVSTYFQ